MKKYFSDNENRICTAIFLIVMFVAISPLVSRYCINGHDLEYHLLRIESLKEGILIGKPFLKVNTLFFGGAGYASSMFYSDFLLYIPAILRAAKLGIGTSYHIYVAIIFVLGYLGTFYCTLKMSQSKYVATIAAVLFTLCPYHMDDMLVRGACGEYLAFIFVPFVVYSLYNLVIEEMDKPWVFAVGFGGLILSHPATLLFSVGLGIIVILVYFKKIFTNKKIIIRLIITTIITMLVTAFFWVPMLEQMLSVSLGVADGGVDMLDAAVSFSEVFAGNFPAVGSLLLVLIIPRFFLSKKEDKILGFTDVLMVVAILFAIGATDIMPWDKLGRILSFVQFPWRMFIMSSTLLAISDAICLGIFVKKNSNARVELAIFIVTSVAICFALFHESANNTGYYDYADDYYTYKPYTANVIGGEWLPTAVSDRESIIELSEHMIASDGTDVPFTREKAVITANIPSCDFVDVPFIFYKGYKANMVKDDGTVCKLRVTDEGINGMCRVYTDGNSGSITVSYKNTTATVFAGVISIVTIIAIAILMIKKRKSDNR